MTTIKTVAVAGASGQVGKAAVEALLGAGFTVTALTRIGSSSVFPAGLKVISVNYESVESLTEALKGQDVVISALGYQGLGLQHLLVEAAAAAGVRRFIPNEFGADLLNPKVREIPILFVKLQVHELLEQKAKETGMTYSLIFTGMFLEQSLARPDGMILDIKNHKGTLYDEGTPVISMITLKTIGKAIVGTLLHEEETKNRGVYVQDIATSQNHILELAKKIQPDATWDLQKADTRELEKVAAEAFSRNPYELKVMGYVYRMYYGGEEYNSAFKKLDNELFGISGMTDADLELLIRDVYAGKI